MNINCPSDLLSIICNKTTSLKMKEEKDYSINLLNGVQTGAMSLANPSTIHLGPLLGSGSNETISIVIPLSAQLASLSRNAAIQQQMITKTEATEQITQTAPSFPIIPKTPKTNSNNRIKEDKNKGCPYPNCSRYGRAFSRAHDLKRHIARHEARENKTEQVQTEPVHTCPICTATFYSDLILQRHKLIHDNATSSITSTNQTPYTCNFCKKTFDNESLLNAHLPSHIKSEVKSEPSASAKYLQNEPLLSFQPVTFDARYIPPEPPTGSNSNDDEYRLEDMLLIRKSSTSSSSSSQLSRSPTSGKIRCEYCSKTFKTKWTLSSHVAAHEGRFQYQCCICSKRFVRKSHYESHVRSHDAARPYVCEHCGKTFKESKHRREHLKRKHPVNRNAIQSLLDSISACVNDDAAAAAVEQTTKQQLAILMPMNFGT